MDIDTPPTNTGMDRETERAVDDIKAALLRVEGKIDTLRDTLLPAQAAQGERIRALENIVRWQWGVIGGTIVGLLAQFLTHVM